MEMVVNIFRHVGFLASASLRLLNGMLSVRLVRPNRILLSWYPCHKALRSGRNGVYQNIPQHGLRLIVDVCIVSPAFFRIRSPGLVPVNDNRSQCANIKWTMFQNISSLETRVINMLRIGSGIATTGRERMDLGYNKVLPAGEPISRCCRSFS